MYGDLQHVQRICSKEQTEKSGRRTEPVLRIANYDVDEETIGQFTGMQDDDGKEIYEGDILLWRTYPVIVGWCGGAFCDRRNDANRLLSNHALNMYKIIGNIHDNPEL